VHSVCVCVFFWVNKNTGCRVNLLRNKKTNKETRNCFQVQYVTCKRLKAVELDARATAWQSGFRTGGPAFGFGEGWGKVGCFQIGHLGFGIVEKDSG